MEIIYKVNGVEFTDKEKALEYDKKLKLETEAKKKREQEKAKILDVIEFHIGEINKALKDGKVCVSFFIDNRTGKLMYRDLTNQVNAFNEGNINVFDLLFKDQAHK